LRGHWWRAGATTACGWPSWCSWWRVRWRWAGTAAATERPGGDSGAWRPVRPQGSMMRSVGLRLRRRAPGRTLVRTIGCKEPAVPAPPLMPAAFLGHGSPMNALERNRFTDAWRAFGASVPRPRAILVVSAHWYINATAVTAMPRPRTIHDFY